jgi:hypothetical protein
MATNGSALDQEREKLREKSKFFRRLEAHRTQGAAELATAVVATVSDAKAISAHVVRFFPQYTLHSETHLWNVLGWMEELAQPAIEELGPLDCALAMAGRASSPRPGWRIQSHPERPLKKSGHFREERLTATLTPRASHMLTVGTAISPPSLTLPLP